MDNVILNVWLPVASPQLRKEPNSYKHLRTVVMTAAQTAAIPSLVQLNLSMARATVIN
jgi:hypothetical protein